MSFEVRILERRLAARVAKDAAWWLKIGGDWYPRSHVPAHPRSPWKTDPARASLHALYAEVDALLADFTCEDTAECCQFAITGREPYPSAVELTEVMHAVAAAGIALGPSRERSDRSSGRGKRSLPMVSDTGRCPLLGDDMRCRIYASRPFGCRTFFCDRATGPGKMPRNEIQRISRAIADLSARHAPRDPHARPLRNALEEMRARGGGR